MNYITREVVWARQLMSDIGFPSASSSRVYEDNSSTIWQGKGHGRHEMTKHIAPRYHYVREMVNSGVIEIVHKSTKEMIADILTKPLSEEDNLYFSEGMMNF